MRGNSSSTDSNGMPFLAQAQKPATKSSTQEYSVPVDIHTAAARLKRYYQFVSNDEVDAIRKKDRNGSWVAGAITDANQEWEAMPGSYYKMGNDWNEYDHLTIELEKMEQGVNYTLHSNPHSDKRLNSEELKKLMLNIKGVAEGTNQVIMVGLC
ncbi:hypothetical protein ACLBOM_08245 [Escherichia coli]